MPIIGIASPEDVVRVAVVSSSQDPARLPSRPGSVVGEYISEERSIELAAEVMRVRPEHCARVAVMGREAGDPPPVRRQGGYLAGSPMPLIGSREVAGFHPPIVGRKAVSFPPAVGEAQKEPKAIADEPRNDVGPQKVQKGGYAIREDRIVDDRGRAHDPADRGCPTDETHVAGERADGAPEQRRNVRRLTGLQLLPPHHRVQRATVRDWRAQSARQTRRSPAIRAPRTAASRTRRARSGVRPPSDRAYLAVQTFG